jgi:hypothetical protein
MLTTRKGEIVDNFIASVDASKHFTEPYPYWVLEGCLPAHVVDDVTALPFEAPDLEGVSGKRELHNKTRSYFDAENRAQFPVCEDVAQAFQDPKLLAHIAETFGAKLDGTYLRIEFAQDRDGFWLEPHTDLGVKTFTLLLYLSKDPQHANLGTDIYDTQKKHLGRSPFKPGGAMIFVPSDITYHGFEARPITGIRKSVIINYVTDEWRAREQLAFPDRPIAL